MELYYKDLISQETSLEKLVDDLMLVVQGAEEVAQAAGSGLQEKHKLDITARLQQLKDGCRRIQQHAISSALAADKVMHQYPYSSAGFAFALGVLAGALWAKKRQATRAGDCAIDRALWRPARNLPI